MKMLALAILLLSFPWLSNAKGFEHNRHNSHYDREYDHSYFWHKINDQRHEQRRCVKEAKYQGELTRRELKQLKRERKYLARQIKHLKRQNYLSRSDRRSIRDHIDQYSSLIYDLSNNAIQAHRNRHDHHQYGYNNRNTRNTYSYDRPFSWANNEYSSGFYFRF